MFEVLNKLTPDQRDKIMGEISAQRRDNFQYRDAYVTALFESANDKKEQDNDS